MGAQIAALAAQLGSAAIGGVAGAVNDERQLRQQGRLQQQQIEGNAQMLELQRQKEMKMWEDTNYSRQVEELKKAGLNPALLYGMSGGGGVTTGGGSAGVSGGQASQSGGGEIMGMLQNAMMKTQMENIQADTELKKAEAANKPIQGANVTATTNLTNVNTAIAEIDRQIKEATMNDAVDIVRNERNKRENEARLMLNSRKISDETYDTQVAQINTELATRLAIKALTEAQTKESGSRTAGNYQGIAESKQDITESGQRMKESEARIEEIFARIYNNRELRNQSSSDVDTRRRQVIVNEAKLELEKMGVQWRIVDDILKGLKPF